MTPETDGGTSDFEDELEEQAKQDRKKNEMLQQKIDDAKVEGWKLDQEQGNRAVMKKPNYGSFGGHVLVAILTIWWTLGIGNALYAGYKYWSDSDKKVLRV